MIKAHFKEPENNFTHLLLDIQIFSAPLISEARVSYRPVFYITMARLSGKLKTHNKQNIRHIPST